MNWTMVLLFGMSTLECVSEHRFLGLQNTTEIDTERGGGTEEVGKGRGEGTLHPLGTVILRYTNQVKRTMHVALYIFMYASGK